MTTELDLAARVAKGAALLDEKRPGWERQIDLEQLDVGSGCRCVTAQLSGVNSWQAGMRQLDLTLDSYTAHGFRATDAEDEDPSTDAYGILNRLWRVLIETRVSTDSESV